MIKNFNKALKGLSYLMRTDVIIVLIGILILLPFLILTYYMHPSGDDFCFNTYWNATSYWNVQEQFYLNVNGRYLATAILSLPFLLSFEFILYKLMAVVILLLLFYSLFYLISVFFTGIKKRVSLIIAFFFLIVYILIMANIVSGIYWLPTLITYQLGNILCLLFLGMFLKMLNSNQNKHFILCVLLLIALIGCNEVSMFIMDAFLVLVFLYKYQILKKVNNKVLLLIIVAIILTLFIWLSPGNYVKSLEFPNRHQFLYSIKNSFLILKTYLIKWLPTVTVLTLLFYRYLKKIKVTKFQNFTRINPILVVGFIFFVLYMTFFMGYWSTGNDLPVRTVNVLCLFFIISFFYFTITLFSYKKILIKNFIQYSSFVHYILLLLIFIQIAKNNNVRTAYADLFSGKAKQFDKALDERYVIINNSIKDTIIVPAIEYAPKSIFVSDIKSDGSNWRNICFNSYFNKTIVLEK